MILADPWGFSERPAHYKPRLFVRILGVILFPFIYFNPLSTVRAIGPLGKNEHITFHIQDNLNKCFLGPTLVRKLRGDIAARYEDSFENKNIITEYIYQCNSQYPR